MKRAPCRRYLTSPAMGTFERVMREGGIDHALRDIPAVCRPFKNSCMVDIGPPFNRIEIAADAIGCRRYHQHCPNSRPIPRCFSPLASKNMFGCIVGLAENPEWHLRAGIDRERFAELLVRICAAVRPRSLVLDGILAMEGQGPERAECRENWELSWLRTTPFCRRCRCLQNARHKGG